MSNTIRTRLTVVAAIVLAAIVAVFGPDLLGDYFTRILLLICMNGVLVASLGLCNGFTGVFSLGHVGFVATAAYVNGILSLTAEQSASLLPDLPTWLSGWGMHFLPATLIAGLVTAALAAIVGLPLMRLSGHFVSVATMGFLIIVNGVLVNADEFTRGSRTFTGVPLDTTLPWAMGWLVITLLVLARIIYSPIGRAMRAVRDNAIAARGIGIDVLRTRLLAFVVGAFFAGVGGSLYARYLGSFSPATFYFAMMINQIAMLVLGGMGSLSGAMIGVVVIGIMTELLRALERGFSIGGVTMPPMFGASQIALGLVFILIMIYRPTGIAGGREIVLWPRASVRPEPSIKEAPSRN